MLFIQSLKWFFCFWYVVIKMSSFLTILMNAHFFLRSNSRVNSIFRALFGCSLFFRKKNMYLFVDLWFHQMIRYIEISQSNLLLFEIVQKVLFFFLCMYIFDCKVLTDIVQENFFDQKYFFQRKLLIHPCQRDAHTFLYIVINCTFELKIIFINNSF